MDTKNSSIFDKNKLKMNLISRYDLSKLDSSGFQEFCYNFLISLGYSDIENILETGHGGITYSINSDDITTYVHCFQSSKIKGYEDNKDDNFYTLGRPDIQMFIGNMTADNISSGIIITNGDLSELAKDYICNLSKEYTLKIYAGCELSQTCWHQKFSLRSI